MSIQCDRYLLGSSNENGLCITTTNNVFLDIQILSLVTIPLLEIVLITEFTNFSETQSEKTLLKTISNAISCYFV